MNVAKIEYGIVQELKKEEEKLWSELQLELTMSCNFVSLRELISLKKRTNEELEKLKGIVVKNNSSKDKVEFMEMCIEEIENDKVDLAMEWALSIKGKPVTRARPNRAKPRAVKKRQPKKGWPKKIERRPSKMESLEEDSDVMITDI